MLTDQLDLSREDSSSTQFIGSLVDTVLKLCLMIVKYSNSESLLAESGSREDQWALGARELLTAWLDPAKVLYQDSVVVVNQNPSENVCNSSEPSCSGRLPLRQMCLHSTSQTAMSSCISKAEIRT